MKRTALVLGVSLLTLSGSAALISPADAAGKPGGCLKYGAAGAVAGHVAHHHAVKGFIAGCAVGMIRRHEYNKQQKALRQKQLQEKKTGTAPTNGTNGNTSATTTSGSPSPSNSSSPSSSPSH